VLWLGEIDAQTARVKRVYVPQQSPVADEYGVGYFVTGETLFKLNRALSENDLRLIAQVHSHPGDAYHSEADDRYAIVTAHGGFSLVVPDFGKAPADLRRWAVYQLDGEYWRELSVNEIDRLFLVDETQ